MYMYVSGVFDPVVWDEGAGYHPNRILNNQYLVYFVYTVSADC